jgi:hypothetical protein
MNKTIVTAKICGGLGNQITQIALAIIIGKLLDKDVIFKKEYTANYGKVRYIRWDTLFSRCTLVDTIQPIGNSIVLNDSTIFHFLNDYKNTVYNDKNIMLDGYFQNSIFFNNSHAYIKDFFMTDFSSLGEVYLDTYKPEDKIAIHIRCFEASSLIGETAINMYDTVPFAYYKSVLKNYKELEGKEILFFLDDVVKEDKVKTYFGEDITIVKESEDLSFYLMSKCKYIIRGNSTFSWWAGFLSETVDKIYVPDKDWIINPSDHLKNMYYSKFIIHGI